MKKLLACIILVAILLLSFSACNLGTSAPTDKKNPIKKPNDKVNSTQSSAQPSKKNTKIKLGFACPLSEASDDEGRAVRNAIELAINEINELGGLDGIKFEAIVLDSNNYINEKDIYEDLKKEGMQVFLGTTELGTASVFSELAEEDNLFVMMPAVAAETTEEFDTTYQMSCSAFEQGKQAAEFFNENYVGKSVGIFYQSDDARSSEIYNGFKETLDPYFSVEAADFTDVDVIYESQVQQLKNCEILFMPVECDSAWMFMSQMKNVLSEVDTYVGCDGFEAMSSVESFDIANIEQDVLYLSYFDLTATDGPVADFLLSYASKYDEDSESPGAMAASVYDSVYAVLEALRMAKLNGKEILVNASPEELCFILEGVFDGEHFDFRGITGACEEGERSHITWEERKAQKTPVKIALKTKMG